MITAHSICARFSLRNYQQATTDSLSRNESPVIRSLLLGFPVLYGRVVYQRVATDPDTIFTPNQLAEHLRVLSGGSTPIGARRLRAEIRAGRLRASRVGSWNWIRFGDFLQWFDSMQVEAESSVTDRVEQRVKMQLRREGKLGGI